MYMDTRLVLVEFSRELDAAEAPVDWQEPLIFQAEPLIFQAEPLIFQAEAPVGCPKPWDLGVESAESAGTFSKLYLRACPRIMRARSRVEKWVQIWKYSPPK